VVALAVPIYCVVCLSTDTIVIRLVTNLGIMSILTFRTSVSSFNKKKYSFHQQIGLKLRKKLVKCYIWSVALYGAETWTLWKADQKYEYLESFEMWC
jgi:hypothetical protein